MTRSISIALCVVLCCTALHAGEDGLSEKDRDAAIRKGIAHLDAHLFKLPDVQGTPRKPFTFAVAGLVYLMEHPPGASRVGRGPTKRIAEYLARYVDDVETRLKDPESLPPRHGLADSRRLIQYTWPLSVAGLFFGELQERGLGSARSKKALRKILAILEDAQQKNGGWGHGRIRPKSTSEAKKPRRDDPFDGLLKGVGSGYPDTLVSSSNCVAICVGLLGTMRGLDAEEAIKKARAYYEAARLDNGSFPYDPSQRQSGFAKTNVGRTAGSIYAMHCLGMPRGRAFQGSVDYLEKNLEWVCEGHGSPCLNMMHGALACHMLGRDVWLRFRRKFETRIIAAQDDEGCLSCICENKAFGVTCDSKSPFANVGFLRDGRRTYTTALHTFVLLLDRGNLQIIKRRKPGPATTPRRR